MSISGDLATPPIVKQYGHDGYPMKDILKNGLAMKKINTFGLLNQKLWAKTICPNFPPLTTLFSPFNYKMIVGGIE